MFIGSYLMNKSHIPACLIIGYSRPDGVSRLIDQAAKAGVTRIYLAIDGQKKENIALKLSFSRIVEFAKTKPNLEVFTWFRENNLGTQLSVISALDWFFSEEESGVILEYDLIPSNSFFTFAANGLNQFASDESVWLISGNQYFDAEIPFESNHWTTYPLIWGWASWAEKWFSMREEMLKARIHWRADFRKESVGFWSVGFSRARNGSVESWAILLAAQMHALGKFCLLPPENLVTNRGSDEVAIHTKEDKWPLNVPTSEKYISESISKSRRIEIARIIDRKIEDSIYGVKRRHRFLPYAEKLKLRNIGQRPFKSTVAERLSRISTPN